MVLDHQLQESLGLDSLELFAPRVNLVVTFVIGFAFLVGPVILVVEIGDPLLPALDLEFASVDLLDRVEVLDLDLDSTHLDDVVFLDQVVLRSFLFDSVVTNHVVHALLHLLRWKQWVSGIVVLIVDVFGLVRGENSLNEILVPHL